MEKLKKNKFILLTFLFCFSIGCQTSTVFEMKTDKEKELSIITVKTNRVIHECYFLNAEKENKWRHRYFIYILNENNVVISLMNPTDQDIDTCKENLKKVEKILKKVTEVRFCARDLLERINEPDVIVTPHSFGPLGTHTSPYYALTFDRICNSRECFGLSKIWKYTCPALY